MSQSRKVKNGFGKITFSRMKDLPIAVLVSSIMITPINFDIFHSMNLLSYFSYAIT